MMTLALILAWLLLIPVTLLMSAALSLNDAEVTVITFVVCAVALFGPEVVEYMKARRDHRLERECQPTR